MMAYANKAFDAFTVKLGRKIQELREAKGYSQEKFKKLKSGDYNRHVYYSCTRRVNPNCQEKYINEIELCRMLQEFIEQNYDKIKITDKLRAKIEKHYQMTKTLMEHYKFDKKLDTPFIEYSRYILSKGTEAERTTFANGITTKLNVKDGVLKLS